LTAAPAPAQVVVRADATQLAQAVQQLVRNAVLFTPAGGDVIVMHGRCQRDWQHCVPKQNAPAGARMSLNFSTALNA
jgi:signal transduction histidine kinase